MSQPFLCCSQCRVLHSCGHGAEIKRTKRHQQFITGVMHGCYMNASRLQQFSCVLTDRMGCSSISGLDAASTAAAGPDEIR